jgi:predicted nucleic acid-binding protein
VVSRLAEVNEDRVFLSVVSFAEIRRGIELMPGGHRRQRLEMWLTEDSAVRFEDRILSINQCVAESRGVMTARGNKSGLTLGSMDAFFAATAEVHRLTLVTRNVRDFQPAGISTPDPWEPRS